ncbi:hypothetical protein HB770_04070 [Rhizobium leguminosarum bv. viciae]|uniref:Uncharacterized protein n=1 Tax=Rhizobium leguminosarum bv. viciae TaxID=387 RepID=A0A7G6RHU0_RHILV|nr:hypothetical protein HB770_04070 [Rhizobium leguminosarum bv. viciae]
MGLYAPMTCMVCADLAIGWQTCTDLSFDFAPIEDSMYLDRTWNGAVEDMSEPEFDLYSVTIRSSGPGELRAPALDNVRRKAEFTCVPTFELDDVIYLGESVRTLRRDPHAGSVRVLDREFNDIPFSIAGRVVTLAAPAASVLRIYYRPIFRLKVFQPWKQTFGDKDVEVSWELYCEEVGGPDE